MYKTTCVITKRYYIGIHSTSNINDDYLGSGKRLRYSVRKYGIENHVKEILNFFESRELLIEEEKKIVNMELLGDKMCMNLKIGGTGGLFGLPKEIITKITKSGGEVHRKKMLEDEEYRKSTIEKLRQYVIINHKNKKYKHINFKGKKHSEETKKKIGETNSKHQKGNGNSQFGTCWITNGYKNKKVKKTDLLEDGWKYGRTFVTQKKNNLL